MQYVVPQFIDVESKIIGPISGRQFIELIVTLGLCYVWFEMFKSPLLFIPLILLTAGVGLVLAFAKVNGQAMHYFLLNLIQTLRRPNLKIWEKMLDAKVEEIKFEEKEEIEYKPPAEESRLAEVSLMVDTGGAYQAQNAQDQRTPDTAVSAMAGQAPAQPQAQEKKNEDEEEDNNKIQLGY